MTLNHVTYQCFNDWCRTRLIREPVHHDGGPPCPTCRREMSAVIKLDNGQTMYVPTPSLTTTPERSTLTTKPIALFDLDGTLADFDYAMRAQLELVRHPTEDPKLDETAYEDVPHVHARRHLIKNQPGFWRNLRPIHAGFQILEETRALGFHHNVLSKSPHKIPHAAGEKIEWCKKHLEGMPITLSEDKGIVYGRVLVDDWPEYVGRWLQHRPRGYVIAVAQPWNTHIEMMSPGRVLRIGRDDHQTLGGLTKQELINVRTFLNRAIGTEES